jgi:phosphatidylinositol alpha 1,6-mannosyltransferase
MSKFLYRSYIALGDSLTEGLGDFDFEVSRFGCGWADRLSELMARSAHEAGESFKFANLALRGSSMLQILTAQLEDALKLNPDVVTIMAGANDFMRSKKTHPHLRALLRGAIERLHNQGCHVILANTVNPVHLAVFRPLAKKSRTMSDLIESVAAEYQVPVLNVFEIKDFKNRQMWCEDLVHFSGYGHIRIANKAASLLGIDHGFEELDINEMQGPPQGVKATGRWLVRDVAPFFIRRIKGITSGNGLEPKHEKYVKLVAKRKRAKRAVNSYAA